ncbi:D-alanyl-D-alanine carboxypeptidase [Enteractinococcus fodinae]|uniref:D-alanyl-D-alanine carboxypeptidase/D-alanyl-D-alanine-endopeptidase (Penicillin-binding protein 4) n=1 Tax=Enteractinococcus fodinae TaxID=684663 RepID=A0ABU2B5V3_9MICC|nr:D-alanyl-D-alanine carboxypeptidase/D-alanyl-D-alanine-endopeptidase [Enteractinococcus fodinae]MDR7348138.1 D-alanyl-D-alanine carboxypeptidase/D-alanyl-D-alanine-endopeptidase (penicillin-binding protein 4) [Enteractinococcus fodinae]
MMAAKQAGRRAAGRRPGRRAWVPVIIGVIVGLLGGAGLAGAYPPPSTDMIKVQAADWYQHMRQLVSGSETTGTRTWKGDPQIYAAPPVALPPEPETNDDLLDDGVADLIDVNAPAPDAHQLTAVLDEAMGELGLGHRMLVVDAATGETLYDRGGQDSVVPASTLKLFTGISLLHHLDPNHRFVTAARYTPSQGVTLVGGGDGLLALGESTGSTVGYAGLADLAQKTWNAIGEDVTAAGVATVNVGVDVSRYNRPWLHPDWTEGLQEAGWVSPVYPLNVYGGLTGHPAYADTAVEDGAGLAASTYTSHLNQLADAAGATVEFQYTGQTSVPDEAEQVAEVRSAPLGRQLEYAMKQSNNMLFEMFGREAAIAAGSTPDFTGSTQATVATLDQLGIDTQPLVFADNSGLSPRSRATLETTVELFELMLTNEHYRPLLHTLTVAGYDGTMENRLTEAPYSGVVRTKTGTLEVASSNAGFTVTTQGRALWFAINTTGSEGDYETTRAEQDHLTQVLTNCQCTAE